MKIAIVIYTYDRTDDAKINQEIIRQVWGKSGFFEDIKIVHTYNGLPNWYPQKYLEDSLVTTTNPGHFQGASDLLDTGYDEVLKQNWDVDYVVFLAADTWIVKPNFINLVINEMLEKKLYLATCAWGGLPDKPGNIISACAVDFFIVDNHWCKKSDVFPLDYAFFYNKYFDLFYYQGGSPSVERLFMSHFLKAIHLETKSDVEFVVKAKEKIRVIFEREPVHEFIDQKGLYVRKMYWPEIGLLTHHNPKDRQAVYKELDLQPGKFSKTFTESKSLDYYNPGYNSNQTAN